MLINLSALTAALAPIEQIGKGEQEVLVDNTCLTLRTLLPDEMVETQKLARVSIEESDDYPKFLEVYKRTVLSYAIIQVNELDLRGQKYLETEHPDGTPDKTIKVEKPTALRKVIETWSGTTISYVFEKYGDLQRRVDIEAEQLIQYIPADLAAEIERLETRLKELKTEQERQQNPTPKVSELMDTVTKVSQTTADQHEGLTTPPVRQRPVAPQVVKAPTQGSQEIQDSFSDDQDAIEAESQRIAADRAARMRAQSQVPTSSPTQTSQRPLPPHLQARQAAQQVPPMPTPTRQPTLDVDPLSEPDPDTLINGIPAFSLHDRSEGPQTLSNRGRNQGPATEKPVVNSAGTMGAVNPRFRTK